MSVRTTITGEGISIDRNVAEQTAVEILELVLTNTNEDVEESITVSLQGEGMDINRDVSEATAVKIANLTIRDGSATLPSDASVKDGVTLNGLPADFFDRLSNRQRIMIEILLEADDTWMRRKDIRQAMREKYDMEVPEGGRATAGVIASLTRKYNKEFRRDVIPGRWADETQRHAEFKIGEKYHDEIEVELK
jgi:hypothetical protein